MTSSNKARYDELHTLERQQFLSRAQHNALLTIPSAVPMDGHRASHHLVEAYQGLGSFAVTHLSNHMTSNLIPAGRPFMRLDPTPQAKAENNGEVSAELEKELALVEQIVQGEVERVGWRDTTLQEIEQLIIAGSVAEYQAPDNTLTMWRIDEFVCIHSRTGQLLELILLDCLSPLEVSNKDISPARRAGLAKNDKGEWEAYTRVVWDADKEEYKVTKELSDGRPYGKPATYSRGELPYRVHRWTKIPGESYGRSKVEIHAGDLRGLEAMEKASMEIGAMAGFHFTTIAPGATAAGIRSRLREIQNGGTLIADPAQVDLKSFANGQGYQIVEAKIQGLVDRLSRGFLLLSGMRRDAERVTAAEIQADVREVERAVGGVFGTLANDMLAVRAVQLINNLVKQEALPPSLIEGGVVEPTILTGLEALSRESDAAKALQGAEIANAFGEQAIDVVKLPRLLGRAYVGLGLPDMIRSEEEADQRAQQRAQQQQMAEIGKAAAGPVAKAAVEGG